MKLFLKKIMLYEIYSPQGKAQKPRTGNLKKSGVFPGNNSERSD